MKSDTVAYEGVREEQKVGLRTILDVLNAQQELEQSQLALVGARHDEYVAAAAVLAAMGALEAKDLLPNEARYDPKANFDRVRHAVGWVPWEGAVGAIDKLGAPSGHARARALAAGRGGEDAISLTSRWRGSPRAESLQDARFAGSLSFTKGIPAGSCERCRTRRPRNQPWRRSSPPSGASSPRMTRPPRPRRLDAPEPAPANEPAAAFEPAPEPVEDELELTERVTPEAETVGDIEAYTQAEPEPNRNPSRRLRRRGRRRWRATTTAWSASPAPSAAAASFSQLSEAIAMPAAGRTLEDLVRELLRPLLKAWLDEQPAAHRRGQGRRGSRAHRPQPSTLAGPSPGVKPFRAALPRASGDAGCSAKLRASRQNTWAPASAGESGL